jgi:hypothetical protein
MIYYPDLFFWYPYLDSISNFFNPKMTLNEKSLNYKVIVLVESYKFRIKFIPSEFIQKSYDFLKTD